jgi:hypothetical protein
MSVAGAQSAHRLEGDEVARHGGFVTMRRGLCQLIRLRRQRSLVVALDPFPSLRLARVALVRLGLQKEWSRQLSAG